MILGLTRAAAVTALFAFASFASASTVEWTLNGVDFNVVGSGGVTGTFDYDADAGTYSNVDLHLIGLPWTFNTVIASAQYTNASNLEVVVPPVESSAPQLQFEFYSPLTDAGGTVAVAVSRFSYCPSSNCSTLGSAADVGTTGTVSEVTPEPATLALSGTAGLAFVLTRLRKRKA